MRVLVTGASGTLGTKLMKSLSERGHDPVGLSRSPGAGRRVGNVTTGEGLAQAVDGMDAIVHAASDARSRSRARQTDVDGTNRLARFGIPILYVSIVGVDRSPFHYYRTKLAGEQVLQASGTPHWILRSTQFHEFIDMLLGMSKSAGAKLPWRSDADAPVYFPANWRLGPVAASDVADRISTMLDESPINGIQQMGGPQPTTSAELARSWVAARGGRSRALPTAGRVAAGFKAGITVPDSPDAVGAQTWSEYLAASSHG